MTMKDLKRYPEMSEPQLRPRYSGVATFFRTPLVESLKGVDIGVIGVPFDGGVTNRTGTRHGPRAVREQTTLVRRVNQATGITPFDLVKVADCGDAFLEGPYELIAAHKEIEDYFAKFKAANVMTLGVGGDHSISLPILRAIAKDGPVGMIHIDAHCDTGDDYLGSKFHHGAPFSRAVEEGLLDPKRVIQIGIRGSINSKDMWKFSHESGMRVVYMEELHDKGWKWAAEEARKIAGTGKTYLSFDIDSLDPVFAPGTGTPESGGITMIEAQRMIRALDGVDFIGADLVEVSPPFDNGTITAQCGANILFEILCVLATARAKKK